MADGAARGQAHRRGAHARRRPDAQRRAGAHGGLQLVFCVLLAAGILHLMNLTSRSAAVAFRSPLRTSYAVLRERTLFDVRLQGDDDVIGRGEAAPLEPYDGVSDEEVRAALAAYAEAVAALGPEAEGVTVLDACRATADLPQALAAIDLALWDRAGMRSGRPVAELLTERPARRRAGQRDGRRRRSRVGRGTRAPRPRAAGFTCVKLKVGIGRRRGPRRRRARRRPDRRWSCGWTRTARGTSRRRCARSRRWPRPGSSSSRSRCTASARCARCATACRCASRWTRPATSRARWRRAPPTPCA